MIITSSDLKTDYFSKTVPEYAQQHDHYELKLIRKALLKDVHLTDIGKEKLLPVIINYIRSNTKCSFDDLEEKDQIKIDAEAFNCFLAISTNEKYHIDIVKDKLPQGLVVLCDKLTRHLKSEGIEATLKSDSTAPDSGPIAKRPKLHSEPTVQVTSVEESQPHPDLTDIFDSSEAEEEANEVETCLPSDPNASIETCLPELDTCLEDLTSESPPVSPSLLEGSDYIASLSQSSDDHPPSPSLLDRKYWRNKNASNGP